MIFPFQVAEREIALASLGSWLDRTFPARSSASLPPTPLFKGRPDYPPRSPFLPPRRDGDGFVQAALELGGEAFDVLTAGSPSLGPIASGMPPLDLDWELDAVGDGSGRAGPGAEGLRGRAVRDSETWESFSLES